MGKLQKRRAISLMVVVIFLLTVVFPVGALAESAPPQPFTVTLLGTSDLHGQLMGWNYFTKSADKGLTRVATLIAQERASHPNNILVDAGDTIQGTPLVYYYNKENTSWMNDPAKDYPMMAAFKYLHYDAWVLGNHEFNFGLNVLNPIIDEASAGNIQVLSANTQDKNATEKDPITGDQPVWSKVNPYTIKTFKDPDGNDFKVGILGLTTPAIPNWESPQNYDGLQFADIVTEGSKWVHYLKDTVKVNAIVAVIHSGLGDNDPSNDSTPNENEVQAFANANPEVNAIMTGHTHSTVNSKIGNTLVVQPKNAASNLEEVNMNFVKDSSGNWVMDASSSDASLAVTTNTPEDSGLVDLAQPYHQAALQYLQTPIGTATGDFLANGQTIKDTALMDLVNKVQMYYGDADLSVAAPFSPTARIPKGNVTIGDVSSVYVYENFLFTVKITGAQLRKYMEMSVGRYYKQYQPGDTAILKNNVPDYNLDILQGANYTIDLTKIGLFDATGAAIPNGEPRITSLTVNGQEVKDTDTYKLALNNYRVSGGGGFLAAAGIVPQNTDPNAPNYITYDSQKALGDDGQVRSLMVRYFQDMAASNTPVKPTYDNNWQTVPRFYDFVEFTDTHGNIDNYPATGTPKANAALLAGAVNQEKATYGDERTVVLSAGDMMQGTPISNVLQGKPVMDIMNQMKFDAMELGNHEFDWGNGVLDTNLNNANFPFLAANLTQKVGDTDQDAAKLMQDVKPYTILNKDGLRIGVIGVILPDVVNIVMPSIIGHFDVKDPATTVNQLVPQVKAAGADIVVVLAHIGDQYNYWPAGGDQPATEPITQDLANLAKGISGVAAVFGGHSHTTNYAMVSDAENKMIPAVIGYANGRGAGVIRLALDANNEVVAAAPNYLDVYNRLYSKLTPDANVQAIVDAAKAQIGPIFDRVIGTAEVDLTRTTASSGNLDSNLGDWSADVTKDAANADFGFQNSGGLRVDIPKGNITVGQIWTLMPFDNEINVMDMTGAQVKEVLEYMASGIKDMGHVGGLRFAYDKNKPARYTMENGKVVVNPAKSRVTLVTLADGTPLDPNKTYKVAAPDFIATGGDNYPFPANSSNLVATHVLVRDAMLNDIQERQKLNYASDGRIQFSTYSTYKFVKPEFSGVIANKEVTKDFNLKTDIPGNSGYDRVRVNVTITKPHGATVQMLGHDPITNKDYDVASQGYWGPVDGMPIAANFDQTDSFKLTFSQAGNYTIRYALTDLDTNQELAVESNDIKVTYVKASISSDLGNRVKEDRVNKFSVSTVGNSDSGKAVRIKVTLTNPRQRGDVELRYYDANGKAHMLTFDKHGVAWFGSEDGFSLGDDAFKFGVEFTKSDVYGYKVEVVQVSNQKVLACDKQYVAAMPAGGTYNQMRALILALLNILTSGWYRLF